jgi:hypothetical protein
MLPLNFLVYFVEYKKAKGIFRLENAILGETKANI